MKYLAIIICCSSLLLGSCSDEKTVENSIHKPKIDEKELENKLPSVKTTLIRLDQQMTQLKNVNDVSAFIDRYPDFCSAYLNTVKTDPDYLQKAQSIVEFYSNPGIQELNTYAAKYWGDMNELEKQLQSLFVYIKHYYPEYPAPKKIYTVITGFSAPEMYFGKDFVVISIDYFMGNKAPYRPKGPAYPEYILSRYQKEYVPVFVAMNLSEQFNKSESSDKTMLANMIYFGKMQYFVERVLPEFDDTLNIQYSTAEIKDISEHTDIIWAHFVDQKLFYENKDFIIKKYTGERPQVNEIGEKCPGRIGRWLGWQIVRKYMEENPTVTFPQLMSETDAQKIFKLSKYKPKK